MIIELMLMLIALGTGIFAVAWINNRNRQKEALSRRAAADSTGKLKQELERTANEIIGRMENHVSHLENILDESDRSRTQLEVRVAEVKKLLKKSEAHSGEMRDLLARLEDAGAEVDGMQRKMDNLERKINMALTMPRIPQMPSITPITPIITPPQMTPVTSTPPTTSQLQQTSKLQQASQVQQTSQVPIIEQKTTITSQTPTLLNPLGAITMQPITHSTPSVSKNDSEAFDKILEESLTSSPKITDPPPRPSIVISPENRQPVKAVDADPVKIEATRKKLTEVSAEMAANPPEEVDDGKVQAQSLRKRRVKTRARDVRKAALDAIREAEKVSATDTQPVEPPEQSAPEKNSRPERRDLKLETTDSSIIKEMLLSGMTVEEISRETGLGRGAIELVQKLTRRQLK